MKTLAMLIVIVSIGFVALILMCLVGCGDHTVIEYHLNTPLENIHFIANNSEAWGHARWDKYYEGNRVHCDIYLAPLDVYKTEECYTKVLEHEKRHCYQFDWHPKGEGYEFCNP